MTYCATTCPVDIEAPKRMPILPLGGLAQRRNLKTEGQLSPYLQRAWVNHIFPLQVMCCTDIADVTVGFVAITLSASGLRSFHFFSRFATALLISVRGIKSGYSTGRS